MEDETTMEHSQDQGEDHQTDSVHLVRCHVSPQTIILRLGTKLHLAKYPTYQVTNAIGVAAGLTAYEVCYVTTKVRKLQNLVAATSGRESPTQKLAGLRSPTFNGERHDVSAYVATAAQHARCVVHGLPKDIPDDQLLSNITIEDRQILAARRIGNSKTILLTVKGATVSKEAKRGLWLTKTQPFRPRVVQCTISLTIGHRADCFNCERPHGARDPRCSKKQQAGDLPRIAAEKRRLKTTPTDSAELQKSQASQSRLTNPAKKYDQKYPLLLLQNRFPALQDSTPNPQPEPLPRSGSLPGYKTKRPTLPPPPPNPKTPSYLQALLSQKPPTPSEGPPCKQPRQSPLDKPALRELAKLIAFANGNVNTDEARFREVERNRRQWKTIDTDEVRVKTTDCVREYRWRAWVTPTRRGIGTAVQRFAGSTTNAGISVWLVWHQNIVVVGVETESLASKLIGDITLTIRDRQVPVQGHLKSAGETCKGVVTIADNEILESL
ncbi:hypothetical protein HPB51_000615 [Rhipicephalus microplus]|uniref:Uncharacterized protein n=1 Tax=Rhipicephalus microplus TaxID=6941 RepID=A0A9J6EQN7_RHIMP|nr:hypothetical protein HPB51_000615 [Rhipicephalus microplus]